MFYIDKEFISAEKAEAADRWFSALPWLKDAHSLRVAVCTEKVEDWLLYCLFMKKRGGSVVPLHSSMTEEGARAAAKKTNSHILIYKSFIAPIISERLDREKVGVLVQMSSGTTGEPKVIERTWHSIEEELEQYAAIFPLASSTPSIVACPTTHSYGLICGFFATLKRQAIPVVITNHHPKAILSAVKKWDKALIYAAPALIYPLAQLSKEKLFAVMISGNLMPAKWFNHVKKAVTHLLQQYGCSEAGCVALHPSPERPDAMGFALPHVRMEAGTENEPGEIILHKKDQTIYTKDLGTLTQTGELRYAARMDDMINVSGMKVFPKEVEDILLENSLVQEAIVYKKEDRWTGEKVCVQLVGSKEQEEELKRYCKTRLIPYQIPVEWHFVSAIAVMPNGKISRKRLGEMTG
ncbi:AMP-binding protein [Jeotgalibacillus proteolyticus]|uniref:AMP-binding protein n=1 Tax=Jeotgalibacillus proteolyticus TaxID=2082395 RepID=UPI003CE8577E